MPLLKRLRTIAAKVESTSGTAESLTASEGVFNAYDIMMQAEIDTEDREAQGSLDHLSRVPGARKGTMTFKTDLAWSGTGTPNWADVLLPGCGYVASSQVFTPRSEAVGSNVKTLTMGVFMNGLYKKLVGAAGTFKINFPAGRMITFEWEFQGVWAAPVDSSLIAPTYPTDTPERSAGDTITYNSVSQKVENVTFDAGNEVILREDSTDAAGYSTAYITNRAPTITLNPELELIATNSENPWSDWIDGDEYAFSLAVDGPTGGTSNASFTLSAPKAQIINAQEADRNGIVVHELELACNKNGATKDADVSLTFTDLV